MMRITDIRTTKQGRMALFGDEEFLFSVDAETLARSGVQVDDCLTDEMLAALREQSDTNKARDAALRLLARRAHGQIELYSKLLRRFDEHSAAAAVAKMCELGLLDDAAFAAEKAQALAQKGKSPAEIGQRLRAVGIDKELAQSAVEALAIDAAAVALAIIHKQYMPKLQQGKRQAVMAALARRGFRHAEISRAVAQALSEIDTRCPEDGEDEELP